MRFYHLFRLAAVLTLCSHSWLACGVLVALEDQQPAAADSKAPHPSQHFSDLAGGMGGFFEGAPGGFSGSDRDYGRMGGIARLQEFKPVPWKKPVGPAPGWLASGKKSYLATEAIRQRLESETVWELADMKLGEALRIVLGEQKLQFSIDKDCSEKLDETVSLKASGPLREVLRRLLDPLNLVYCVRPSCIEITNVDPAGIEPTLRCYDIANISSESIDFPKLMQSIESTIQPDIWGTSGGACSMVPIGSLLVVLATEKAHLQIEQLLFNLAESKSISLPPATSSNEPIDPLLEDGESQSKQVIDAAIIGDGKRSVTIERNGHGTSVGPLGNSFDLGDSGDEKAVDIEDYAFQIFVGNADGSAMKRLVDLPDFQSQGSPDWSQDGKRIAFDGWKSQDGERYVNGHVFVANADGTDVRDLGPGSTPSLSPLGNRVVFSRAGGPDEGGIWILDVANPESRTRLDPSGWGPDWSPDGTSIAYTTGNRIVIRRIVEATTETLFAESTSPFSQIFWNLQWSPDSRRIAFKGVTRDNKSVLATVDAYEKNHEMKIQYEGDIQPAICWHPNNRQILVSLDDPARGKFPRLYSISLDQPGSQSFWRGYRRTENSEIRVFHRTVRKSPR
jgi:TolB protein